MNFLFPVLFFLGLFLLRTGQKSDAESIVVLRKMILVLPSLSLKEMTLG